MSVGNAIAAQKAFHIQKYGDPVTVDGQSKTADGKQALRAIVESVSPFSAPDNLPEGARNAANADLQMIEVSAVMMGREPPEQAIVLWNGGTYIVLRVVRTGKQGVFSKYGLICYRKPQVGVSASDADQRAEFAYVPVS